MEKEKEKEKEEERKRERQKLSGYERNNQSDRRRQEGNCKVQTLGINAPYETNRVQCRDI